MTINISKSNNCLLYLIQNSVQSHHFFRMPRPSFRTMLVSITFYHSSINVFRQSMAKAFKKKSNHGKVTIFYENVIKQ